MISEYEQASLSTESPVLPTTTKTTRVRERRCSMNLRCGGSCPVWEQGQVRGRCRGSLLILIDFKLKIDLVGHQNAAAIRSARAIMNGIQRIDTAVSAVRGVHLCG